MHRDKYILAVLSASDNAIYSPVQLQKLFFLLDKTLGEEIGAPFFDFIPYHYGPFDKNVYRQIGVLETMNFIYTDYEGFNNLKKYKLTKEGQEIGEMELSKLDQKYQNFIWEMNKFVKSLSFQELISTIYKAYPEMKVNSVFRS